MKKQTICPHCKMPLNLGSLVAKAKWNNKSKEEIAAHMKMMNAASVNKRKLSTAK